MSRRTLVLSLLFALVAAALSAQTPSPAETGMRYEMEGRWDAAVAAYESVLAQQPGREDLWLRISDIKAKQGHPEEAAAATEKALALRPQDDALWLRLSQEYAVANEPKKAQDAIEHALALKPDDPQYLRSAGELACWNGDYAAARKDYGRLLQLSPGDAAAELGLARAESWSGHLDEAIRRYRAYTAKHPDDKAARMELVQAVTWAGDYAGAMKLLEGYGKDFGGTDAYLQQKALILALARRSADSTAISGPLLLKHPDDFMLRYARTVALANGRRPAEAVQSLDDLRRLAPGDPMTKGAELYVLTPLRTYVTAGALYSHDSDGIDIWHYTLDASFKVDPETQVLAGLARDRETAPAGSGLDAPDGRTMYQNLGYVGFRHRFSPGVSLDATVGGAKVEDGASTAAYSVGADFNPSDQATLRVERIYGFYAVSPRALALGIKQALNQIQLHSDLDLTWHLDALGGYDTYSDGNRKWELAVAPRAAVMRTESFNLDLGVRAWWFGFSDQPGNGYYDPTNYQRYSITAFGYWKIDDNDGVSIVLAPGYFRDSFMDQFKFGLDASVEGTFGIYKNWMLVVRASHVNNARVASGAYDATMGQILLCRRF